MCHHILFQSSRRDATGSLSLHADTRAPVAILMAVLATVAWPAMAQQATDRESGTVVLDPIILQGLSFGSGLDLQVRSDAGSRLGLSSLETPASVQVIEAGTIRQRGQHNVNQAIVQNATGISYHGAPGNGGSSFSMRGFNGHASVTSTLR